MSFTLRDVEPGAIAPRWNGVPVQSSGARCTWPPLPLSTMADWQHEALAEIRECESCPLVTLGPRSDFERQYPASRYPSRHRRQVSPSLHGRIHLTTARALRPNASALALCAKDTLWSWLGLGIAVAGPAFTATTIAMAPRHSSPSSGISGISGSSGPSTSGSAGGMLAVGAIALGLDAWALVDLVGGPTKYPAIVKRRPDTIELPRALRRSGPSHLSIGEGCGCRTPTEGASDEP